MVTAADALAELIEARDACQAENSRLALAKQQAEADRDRLVRALHDAWELLREVVVQHADRDSSAYNHCDDDEGICAWCEDALGVKAALGAAVANKGDDAKS